jgi:cell filamentation protein
VPEDPYADPATGVLRNKLGLSTATDLETAEREITHAALIVLKESPVRPSYDLSHLCAIHRRILGDIYDWAGQLRTVAIAKGSCEVNAIHPFREGNGRAQRAFFEQLASDAGFILDWQHLDADRNTAASAAIMRGDPALMRKMLDELVRGP